MPDRPRPSITPDPFALAERRAVRAERSEREQARRALRAEDELDERRELVADLEARLAAAEHEQAELSATLGARLAERDRLLTQARQQAHAEERRREEAAEAATELARLERGRAAHERRRGLAATAQADRLAGEVEELRHSEAEAQQAAAAADVERRRMRTELADALAHLDSLEQRSSGVERELRRLRGRLQDEQLRHQALDQRRRELDADTECRQDTGPFSAEPQTRGPRHVAAPFRQELAESRRTSSGNGARPDVAAAPVPGAAPAARPATGPSARPWLADGLRRLARRDPDSAVALGLELVAAQASLSPDLLDYDLHLPGPGWHRVSFDGETASVVPLRRRRSRREAQFRVRARPRQLVELLVAGGRDARRPRARVRGTMRGRGARARLQALHLGIDSLTAAGVHLDPLLVLRALAALIEARWTRGHAFCVAHEVGEDPVRSCWLVVRGGRAPVVVGRSPGDVVATVRLSLSAWTALMSGQPPAPHDRPTIRGDAATVSLLEAWARRARGAPGV